MRSVLSFYPLIASVKILCSLFYSSNLLCIFLISISSISALFLCMIKFRRSLASLSWISKVILSLEFHIPVKVKPLGDDWDGICFVTFVKSNAKALLTLRIKSPLRSAEGIGWRGSLCLRSAHLRRLRVASALAPRFYVEDILTRSNVSLHDEL